MSWLSWLGTRSAASRARPHPRVRLAVERLEDRCTPVIVTGPDVGMPPIVRVFDNRQALLYSFMAYESNFLGGVRVALGDLDNDGTPEIITGPGPGRPPTVRVWNLATGAQLAGWDAFSRSFRGGIFVAAGQFDNDSSFEVVVGRGPGGDPRVRIFDVNTSNGAVSYISGPLRDFLAFKRSFTGGVRVAAGDYDGGGSAEVIAAQGIGGRNVRIFSNIGGNRKVIDSFVPYITPNLTNGIYVAAADINNNGRVEVITGPGQGVSANVKVWSDTNSRKMFNFYAYNPKNKVGARVAALDFNVDGRIDQIVTGPGPGIRPQVRRFSISQVLRGQFDAYQTTFKGGIFVAAV